MSEERIRDLVARITKLGICCDLPPRLDRIDPPVAALACFPMYMVASAAALADSNDGQTANYKDLFHLASVREAFVVGEQENRLPVADADAQVLHGMLAYRRPADIVIYEFAMATLKEYFDLASSDAVELGKAVVARSIVAVARAAGEGWFGSGSKPSHEQRACITAICAQLKLRESATAGAILQELSETPA